MLLPVTPVTMLKIKYLTMKQQEIDGKTTPIAYAEGILTVWDEKKKAWRTYTSRTPYHPAWRTPNVDFDTPDPERRAFLYGMASAECKAYALTDDKLEVAQRYIEELRAYDPHHVYTIEGMTLRKERVQPRILTGAAAEAEEAFLRDAKRLNSETRQMIIEFFDDYKKNLITFC